MTLMAAIPVPDFAVPYAAPRAGEEGKVGKLKILSRCKDSEAMCDREKIISTTIFSYIFMKFAAKKLQLTAEDDG